jgi:hypothetical protein
MISNIVSIFFKLKSRPLSTASVLRGTLKANASLPHLARRSGLLVRQTTAQGFQIALGVRLPQIQIQLVIAL